MYTLSIQNLSMANLEKTSKLHHCRFVCSSLPHLSQLMLNFATITSTVWIPPRNDRTIAFESSKGWLRGNNLQDVLQLVLHWTWCWKPRTQTVGLELYSNCLKFAWTNTMLELQLSISQDPPACKAILNWTSYCYCHQRSDVPRWSQIDPTGLLRRQSPRPWFAAPSWKSGLACQPLWGKGHGTVMGWISTNVIGAFMDISVLICSLL